jgi:CDP-6-deoxy-D-xylo-4-hexulose-3-dehydrase
MKIPLNASTFGEEEISAAIDVLRSGFVTFGERCLSFEAMFADYIGSKHAIFVNSGSSANLLAFFALVNSECPTSVNGAMKLEPGQEVIVPAVTWSTSVWPIVQAGLIPVLVDSDPESLQMSVASVENAFSKNTGAICPVHVLGNSAPLTELLGSAKREKIWVIEDTCESLGTRFNDQFVGTFGDVGTYSFFFSHHITTIEGGMIVTNNDEMAELFRCLRAHGWTRHLKNKAAVEAKHADIDPRFLFINTGFNVRPTEINAAFGMKQLGKLEGFNQRRVEIANFWIEDLWLHAKNKAVVPMRTTPGASSTWFGFPVLCESKDLRDRLQRHLEKSGIETRPVIAGNLARQPAFKNIKHRVVGDLLGANAVMDRGLFWGSHPLMTQQEVEYVSKCVKEFFL